MRIKIYDFFFHLIAHIFRHVTNYRDLVCFYFYFKFHKFSYKKKIDAPTTGVFFFFKSSTNIIVRARAQITAYAGACTTRTHSIYILIGIEDTFSGAWYCDIFFVFFFYTEDLIAEFGSESPAVVVAAHIQGQFDARA